MPLVAKSRILAGETELVIALGAVAAAALMDRSVVLARERGSLLRWADGRQGLATIHPSAILRIPDETSRHAAYSRSCRRFAAGRRFGWRANWGGMRPTQAAAHMPLTSSLQQNKYPVQTLHPWFPWLPKQQALVSNCAKPVAASSDARLAHFRQAIKEEAQELSDFAEALGRRTPSRKNCF